MFDAIRLPRGQRLVRCEESIDGDRIALATVVDGTKPLFATYWVDPAGYVEDPVYSGSFARAAGSFEARLQGTC